MDIGKISVIMGVYNCALTLTEAIDSILAQTYSNWEFIICDDCSTDDTYAVAAGYRDRYPDKIILVQNEVNSKLAASLNHCLRYASGKYIARMDGDDISEPTRFEKQIAYLQTHCDCDLVGTAMQRFSAKGLGAIDRKLEHPNRFSLRRVIPFNHATIMTYKRVFDTLGGYTVAERTKRAQDYDLWFRFYHAGFRGDNLPEVLYWVREDEAAIRRRTFKVRWNAFKTTCYGYKLLDYPKYWLIRPFLFMLIKSLIPAKVVLFYRDWQTKRNR